MKTTLSVNGKIVEASISASESQNGRTVLYAEYPPSLITPDPIWKRWVNKISAFFEGIVFQVKVKRQVKRTGAWLASATKYTNVQA